MRILQVTPYPTINLIHGGQIRCYEIAKKLRSLGHQVESLAIYPNWAYTESSKDDLPVDHGAPEIDHRLPRFADYFVGEHAVNNHAIQNKLEAYLRRYRPEIVVLEHPWNFNAVNKALVSVGLRARLIYSSHNVEYLLKKAELSHQSDHSPSLSELNIRCVQNVEKMERLLIANADKIITCTLMDADHFASFKTEVVKTEICVAGNGVQQFDCSESRVNDWLCYFGVPYPAFVSSAHPPNADGFWDMLAPGLTFLKPDEHILVLGGVSTILVDRPGASEFNLVNRSRLDLAGYREKTELQAMLRAAHVILLPITSGGGSNLKAAEALEAGVPVVATTMALRGFEYAAELPHVHVLDDRSEFRRRVRHILDQPRRTNLTPLAIREKAYWKNTLAPLIDVLH